MVSKQEDDMRVAEGSVAVSVTRRNNRSPNHLYTFTSNHEVCAGWQCVALTKYEPLSFPRVTLVAYIE